MNDEIELCRGQEVQFDWRLFAAVGGRPAVLAKETYDNDKSSSYYAAYSPDGAGYSGSVIASIYYFGSAEGHEYPDLQVGDEVNPRTFFVLS